MRHKIAIQPVTVPARGNYPSTVKPFQAMPCEHDTTKIFVSTPTGFVIDQHEARSLARLLDQMADKLEHGSQ
ncbi:hypothetical protein [Corynebacterium diphtheriae]|uniref:hypothetical protein n=1 Tax=Corynebacterium diphtheriae TaxID=1717 RepID=UPI000B53B270|nr:hypothetical protein [Corynebacterium diphtheriae]OWX99865.1 hypothetical protein B1A53_02540 [Corynebacterium diphtheriae]CAB0804843.1 hypothetical protein FRC0292_00499 [Corynebacterium diphtheriae]